jgi:PAS domain S-box-containing protein
VRALIPFFLRHKALRQGLTGLLVSMCVGAIAALVMDARHQMGQLLTATQDNVEWSVSQWEAEVVSLENALVQAIHMPPADLDTTRLRFDIFYSRIDTMRSSPIYSGFRETPVLQGDLARIYQYLEHWSPVIDGPDKALKDALVPILEETREIRQLVRQSVVIGNDYFARKAAQQRRQIARTLMRVAVLTVTLVAILLLLVGALLQLARQRTRDVHHHRAIRDRIETIVSTSQDAIIVVNRDGQVIEYNGAAEKLFGYTPTEALGKLITDLILPPARQNADVTGMEQFLQAGVIGQGTSKMRSRRKDGTTFPADVTLATADSPEGEIFVGFVRDISEQLQAEDALKETRDRAIAGEKQKAELLAVMSHEMRTPLNGMLGTLELFDTKSLSAQQKRYMQIIKNSGRLLLSHVNDVLDVSRLDSGKLVMRKREFDLIGLMSEVLESQIGNAMANGNRLQMAPPDPLLHLVYSDPERLRQVLLNLVGNAVKFTKDGDITLEAECLDGCHQVELRVSDTGQGIEESDLNRIFDDFVSIDASYGRSNTGTGLGLAISRRLTKALGGEMGAESIPGEGSVFWLRLPMASDPTVQPQTDDPDPETPHIPDLPPMQVLVVEDNEVNRMVTSALLTRQGHTVIEAEDGLTGAELARDTAFDLILMDISMPGMDGIETTRLIRSQETAAPVPIIATTAHALPDEVQAFRAAGMNEVLVKPLRTDTMFETIARATGHHVEPQNSRQDPPLTEAPLLDCDNLGDLLEALSPAMLRSSFVRLSDEMSTFFTHPHPRDTAEDRVALGDELHRLAGSAGVFGAMQLVSLLRQLQTHLRDYDKDTFDEALSKVETCWMATQSALNKHISSHCERAE